MFLCQVLATDNAKHMSLLAALKTMTETKKVAGKHLVLESFTDKLHVSSNSYSKATINLNWNILLATML